MSEETPEVEEKRPPGRPRNVEVRIRMFRGKPAAGGVFLESHKGMTMQEMDDGKKEYQKLRPGEQVVMTEKEFDELVAANDGALRDVLEIAR